MNRPTEAISIIQTQLSFGVQLSSLQCYHINRAMCYLGETEVLARQLLKLSALQDVLIDELVHLDQLVQGKITLCPL